MEERGEIHYDTMLKKKLYGYDSEHIGQKTNAILIINSLTLAIL